MQFSLFGAEAGELVLADLDGVLLGGGHWLRTGPDARLSVVVGAPWRAAALLDAFAALGVGEPAPGAGAHHGDVPGPGAGPGPVPRGPGSDVAAPPAARPDVVTPAGGHLARTALTPALVPWERRWRRGAVEAPPDDLVLSAAGLRLWAVTAGGVDEVGYVLRTPAGVDPAGPGGRLHRIAGSLLARTGIAAVELGARGGPGWRVTSARRLRRLAELVGAPPAGGEADWPTAAPGATRTAPRP